MKTLWYLEHLQIQNGSIFLPGSKSCILLKYIHKVNDKIWEWAWWASYQFPCCKLTSAKKSNSLLWYCILIWSEQKGMLRTQFCVSEWLQLLSVPCSMEGGEAALWVLASPWPGPCWFLQGIPVARCHLWAAGWSEAAQGQRAPPAVCACERAPSLSLRAASGWHSAQEVHPAQGEGLQATGNFGKIPLTCCLAFPDAGVCMQVQKHFWDSSLLSLRQRPLGSALSYCRSLVGVKNAEPISGRSRAFHLHHLVVNMTRYKNVWGVSKGLWCSLLAAAWAGNL